MGATKRHIHNEQDLQIADLFKALGHPARIQIINVLLENENFNCTELGKKIPLAQSTISRHLKELYSQRILGYTAIGNSAFYYINFEAIDRVIKYLTKCKDLLSKSERNLINLYILPKFQNVKSRTAYN